MNPIEILSFGKELVEALGEITNKTRLARWKMFLYGCRRQLEDQGELKPGQEAKLVELFSNEFAKESAYDFIRRAIDNNSEISRLALARLYVRCASRTPPHATYDESILLNAYRDLDDRDVNLLLKVCDLAWDLPRSFPSVIEKLNRAPTESLEMSRFQYDEWKSELTPFQCHDVFELRDTMEQFADRRVFQSTVGLLGRESGDAFSLGINPRSAAFVDDLRWARACLRSH